MTYTRRTIVGIQVVGYYDAQGNWHTDSECCTKAEAEDRRVYLNGGGEWSLRHSLDARTGSNDPS